MRTLVFLCLFVSATAHAQLVTIDAGAHPTGTNLVSLTPGARITTLTNEGAGSGYYTQPVVTVPNTWATGAGPHFFGHNNAWSLVARWDFRNVFGLEGCFRRGG